LPDEAPTPTPPEPPRPASGAFGAPSERELFLPRPGESAEAYAARLRRIRAELTRLLGAVERGLRTRDAPGLRRAGRFLRAEPEGLGAPQPVPGEDRQRPPEVAAAMREALAPRPARPAGAVTRATAGAGSGAALGVPEGAPVPQDRRGAPRRDVAGDRRSGPADRRGQALGAPHGLERRAGPADRRTSTLDRRRGERRTAGR
jgi:hypothetical protein